MERWFISMVGDDKYLYWITELGCHFMRMEISTGKIEYLHPHINGTLDETRSAAVLCMENNKIYFVVNRGERLLIYDLETNSIEVLNIQCIETDMNMYSFAKKVGDEIVLLPIFYHEILYINICTGKVRKENILEGVEISGGFKQYFSVNCLENGDDITFISTISGELITYSLEQKKVTNREKLPKEMDEVIDFVCDRDNIIGLNSQNAIMVWERPNCRLLFQCEDNKEGRYSLLHMTEDKVWMLPLFAEDICSISLTDAYCEKYKNFPEDYEYTAPKSMGKFFKKYVHGEKTYFAMHSGNYIFSVNNTTGMGNVEKVIWPDTNEDIEELNYQKRSIFFEEWVSISTFLKYITQKACEHRENGRFW